MFITLEGCEGAGKTTLIKTLKEALETKGLRPFLTREPGGTSLGETLRHLLLDSDTPLDPMAELFLLLAARAQHMKEKIKPALERGEVVLCDRFHDSTIAYQGGGRELGLDKVERLCLLASDGLEPDLTFLLDVDPSIGLLRVKGRSLDRFEREKRAFHERVRVSFLTLAQKNKERIFLIDSSKPQEVVKQLGVNRLLTFLQEKR